MKQADGTLKVVARTGTVIPGVGTINHAVGFFSGQNLPQGSALMNERGQVVFIAQLQDTTATAPVCSNDPNTVLVVATPVDNQE